MCYHCSHYGWYVIGRSSAQSAVHETFRNRLPRSAWSGYILHYKLPQSLCRLCASISVYLRWFRYTNISVLIHSFGTYKYVHVHFHSYMFVAVRRRTLPQVYVQFDTIWYVLVGFRIKCPNLNQNISKRTESYRKVQKHSDT